MSHIQEMIRYATFSIHVQPLFVNFYKYPDVQPIENNSYMRLLLNICLPSILRRPQKGVKLTQN